MIKSYLYPTKMTFFFVFFIFVGFCLYNCGDKTSSKEPAVENKQMNTSGSSNSELPPSYVAASGEEETNTGKRPVCPEGYYLKRLASEPDNEGRTHPISCCNVDQLAEDNALPRSGSATSQEDADNQTNAVAQVYAGKYCTESCPTVTLRGPTGDTVVPTYCLHGMTLADYSSEEQRWVLRDFDCFCYACKRK